MRPLYLLHVAAVCAITLLAAAPAADANPADAQLSLRRHIAIDIGTIRLGDLFDGLAADSEFADTVVAYAPQPGRRAVFDADWLGRLSYRLRLAWRPTSRLDRVIVERTSTVVSSEHIAEALLEELTRRGVDGEFDIELSNRNLLLHIDSGKPATVEVASLATDARNERFNAIIAVPAGDPQAQRFAVTGRIFATVEVPVPARALRPAEVIRPDDIEWRRVRAAEVRTNMLTDSNLIIGQEARRPLRAGAPVRISDVRDPVTIAKGAMVTMLYQTRAMLLTATGRAQQSGSTGDVIRIVNSQTAKTIDARILGPDRVEVITGEQVAFGIGDGK